MAALCLGGALVGVPAPAAAHLKVGTITVCRPPSTSFNPSCSQSLANGAQTGLLWLDPETNISVRASGLRAGAPYSICISHLSCDAFPGAGSTSLLGWDSQGRPNTVTGPDFLVGTGTGAYPVVTVPDTGVDGYAEIYFQEEPERIEGNGVVALMDSDGGGYPPPPPGPPAQNVRAVAQPTQATVSWDQPSGDPPSRYTVSARTQPGALVASQACAACTAATFAGLELGRVHYFEVTAEYVDRGGQPATSNRIIAGGLLGGPVTGAEALGGDANPAEPNLACGRRQATDFPVSVATGNFWHRFEDVAIPGRGVPLAFTRTYNSQAAAVDGPLGHGWTFSYGASLAVDATSGVVTVRQEDASEVRFMPTGAGTYTAAAPRVVATLVPGAGGGYVFTRRADRSLTFDTLGRLTSIDDANGYRTRVEHLASTTVVTDPAGRTLTLGYEGGRITTVTDANEASLAPRVVRFAYDGAGDLVEAVDLSGGRTTFAYQAHRLVRMREPKYADDTTTVPVPEVTNRYDAAGRVDRQTDQLGRTTTFDYSVPGTTTVVDPKGNRVQYDFAEGLVARETRGFYPWTYEYDRASVGCTQTTDPNGHTWSATYDASGNRLTSTDPVGKKTIFTYNERNLMTSRTDPRGSAVSPPDERYTTRWDYDELCKCNLTKQSRPLLDASATTIVATQETFWRYLERGSTTPGDVTSVRDPEGHDWLFDYDANGYRVAVVSPLGHRSTRHFDGVGRMDWRVSARGNAPGADPEAYRTRFGYDPDNRLTTLTDPHGALTRHRYDANRNLEAHTDADTNTTSYTYDPANQLRSLRRADQSVTSTEYWPDGTVRSTRDGAGRVTSYGYDTAARPTTVTDPVGRTTTWSYDRAGNLTGRAHPGGNCNINSRCTRYRYDAAGRLSSVDYSDPATPDVTAIAYDEVGQRRSMTDGTGTSRWEWDSLGRLSSSTDGAGATVTYGWDRRDLLTTIAYPGTPAPLTRHFDADARMDWLEDWNGARVGFEHDPEGHLSDRRLPAATGVADELAHDRAGRLESVTTTRQGAPLASFTYGRTPGGLVSSADHAVTGLSPASAGYAYSPLNQVCWQGAAPGPCASPPEGATRFGYDAADNLVRRGEAAQVFDDANQLCWTGPEAGTCAAAPAGATVYAHDDRGNRMSVSPPGGPARTLGYDQANRLTSHTTATAATYAYDGDGLRTAKTTAGTTTTFTWDQAQGLPLLLAEGSGASATRYIYGPDDLPVQRVDSTGVVYYHHDHLGSTRLLTDATGAVVRTQDYDAYGSPTASTGTVVQPFGFAGEYTDAETGFQYLRARYYDPATGQFITRDPLEPITGTPYAYAYNSPLNFTDPSGDIPLLAAAALAWGAFEVGSAVVDAFGTANAFRDPCASGMDKLASAGLFAFGAIAPGAGYSTAPRSVADDLVPDDFVVVRGGTSDVPPPGEIFSGAAGRTLDDAAAGVPHGQIRVTTAGEIRAGGGSVQHAPELTRSGVLNERHVNVCLGTGPCPFGPLQPNPVPKPGRIQ